MAKLNTGSGTAPAEPQNNEAENYFDADQKELDNLKLGIFAEGEFVVVMIDNCYIKPTKNADKIGLLCFLQGDDNYHTITYWTDVSFLSKKYSEGRSAADLVRAKEQLIDLLDVSGSSMTLSDVRKEGSAALEADLKGNVFVISVKVSEYDGEDRNNVYGMRELEEDDEIPQNIADLMEMPF